jgi:hypothetical protein
MRHAAVNLLEENVMNAVTYGGAGSPHTPVSQRAKVEKRRGLFARFMDALAKSRRQQARRVIENHTPLLSDDADAANDQALIGRRL